MSLILKILFFRNYQREQGFIIYRVYEGLTLHVQVEDVQGIKIATSRLCLVSRCINCLTSNSTNMSGPKNC